MNLYNEIMNIQVKDDHELHHDAYMSYKIGHRDARHAATELSLKADARIEELELALRDVYLDSGFRNLCESLQDKIEELLK